MFYISRQILKCNMTHNYYRNFMSNCQDHDFVKWQPYNLNYNITINNIIKIFGVSTTTTPSTSSPTNTTLTTTSTTKTAETTRNSEVYLSVSRMTENGWLTDFVLRPKKATTAKNGSGKASSINDVTIFFYISLKYTKRSNLK